MWFWVKKFPKTPFNLKVSQNIFISKTNIKPVADIVFDLRNEFHANRMKFGVFVEKIFFCQFWPILTPLVLKVENFGQNWSSRAEKLATSLFLYGESEKIGPEAICRPVWTTIVFGILNKKDDVIFYLLEEPETPLETIRLLALQFLGLCPCALFLIVLLSALLRSTLVVWHSISPFVLAHVVLSFGVVHSLFPFVLDRFLGESRLKSLKSYKKC